MAECRAAFYARVSSEAQARDHTIASQVAALRERVATDGAVMVPDHAFIDEGHSGSSLVRPALEKLRDVVAAGEIDRVYVLAPDRLARRHAHQALLMEELRRAGVERRRRGHLPQPPDRRRPRGRPAAADPRRHRRI
jgi:site-specific DNA recombinase